MFISLWHSNGGRGGARRGAKSGATGNSNVSNPTYNIRGKSSEKKQMLKTDTLRMKRLCEEYARLEVLSGECSTAADTFSYVSEKCSNYKAVIVKDAIGTKATSYFSIRPFSEIKRLHLIRCPPSLVRDLYSHRHQIEVLDFVDSGIPDLVKVLVPIEDSNYIQLQPFIMSDGVKEVPGEYVWGNVTHLRLYNCGISRLDQALHFFPSVEFMDLSANDISRIAHFQDCYQLQILNLSRNRIADLSNIGYCLGNICQLNLSYNRLESLEGLEKLFALEQLDLSSNLIDDFTEMRHISNLPCLINIHLRNNPIASREAYRLCVFQELIQNGSLMYATRSVPLLDSRLMSMAESKALVACGILFKVPEDQQRFLTNLHMDNGEFTPGSGVDSLRGMDTNEEDIDMMLQNLVNQPSDMPGDPHADNKFTTRMSEYVDHIRQSIMLRGDDEDDGLRSAVSPSNFSPARPDDSKNVSINGGNEYKINYDYNSDGRGGVYTPSNLSMLPCLIRILERRKRHQRGLRIAQIYEDESSLKQAMPRIEELNIRKHLLSTVDNVVKDPEGVRLRPSSIRYGSRHPSIGNSRSASIAISSLGSSVDYESKEHTLINTLSAMDAAQVQKDVLIGQETGTKDEKANSSNWDAKIESMMTDRLNGDAPVPKSALAVSEMRGVPATASGKRSGSPTPSKKGNNKPKSITFHDDVFIQRTENGFVETLNTLEVPTPEIETEDPVTPAAAPERDLIPDFVEETNKDTDLERKDGDVSSRSRDSSDEVTPDAQLTSLGTLADHSSQRTSTGSKCSVRSFHSPFDDNASEDSRSAKSSPFPNQNGNVFSPKSPQDLSKVFLKGADFSESAEEQHEESVAVIHTPEVTHAPEIAPETIQSSERLSENSHRSERSMTEFQRRLMENSRFSSESTLSYDTESRVGEASEAPTDKECSIAGTDSISAEAFSPKRRDGRIKESPSDEDIRPWRDSIDGNDDTVNHLQALVSETAAANSPSVYESIGAGSSSGGVEGEYDSVSALDDGFYEKESRVSSSASTANVTHTSDANDQKEYMPSSSTKTTQVAEKYVENSDGDIDQADETDPEGNSAGTEEESDDIHCDGDVCYIGSPKNAAPDPIFIDVATPLTVSPRLEKAPDTVEEGAAETAEADNLDLDTILNNVAEWDSDEEDNGYQIRRYVGNKEYSDMTVRDNLELYMKEQCFNPRRPSGRSAYLAVLPEVPASPQSSASPLSPSNSGSATAPRSRLFSPKKNTDAVGSPEVEPFVRAVDCNGELSFQEVDDIMYVPAPPRPETYKASFSVRVIDLEDFNNLEQGLGELSSTKSAKERTKQAFSKVSKELSKRDPPPNAAQSNEMPIPELSVVLVLTDVSLYVVYADSVPADSMFIDAPLPYVYRVHPLHHLRLMTTFFGYQRVVFEFRALPLGARYDERPGNLSALYAPYTNGGRDTYMPSSVRSGGTVRAHYRYSILSRDQARTKDIITLIPSETDLTRMIEDARELGRQNARSTDRKMQVHTCDEQLFTALHESLYTTKEIEKHKDVDKDVLWYQMLHQTWRKRPGVFIARSVIMTSHYVILCDEDPRSVDVQLLILDKVKYKDITKIEEGSDAVTNQQMTVLKKNARFDEDLAITFHLKGPHVYSAPRKWRLICETKKTMNALVEQVRDMCIAVGNVLD